MTKRHWIELAEYITIVSSFGGAIATIITKEVILTATPLTLALTFNVLNRQRQIQSLTSRLDSQLSIHQGQTKQQLSSLDTQLELLKQETETKTNTLSQLVEESHQNSEKAIQLITPIEQRVNQLKQSFAEITNKFSEWQDKLLLIAELEQQLSQLKASTESQATNLELQLTSNQELIEKQLELVKQETEAKTNTLSQLVEESHQNSEKAIQLITPIEQRVNQSKQSFAEINNKFSEWQNKLLLIAELEQQLSQLKASTESQATNLELQLTSNQEPIEKQLELVKQETEAKTNTLSQLVEESHQNSEKAIQLITSIEQRVNQSEQSFTEINNKFSEWQDKLLLIAELEQQLSQLKASTESQSTNLESQLTSNQEQTNKEISEFKTQLNQFSHWESQITLINQTLEKTDENNNSKVNHLYQEITNINHKLEELKNSRDSEIKTIITIELKSKIAELILPLINEVMTKLKDDFADFKGEVEQFKIKVNQQMKIQVSNQATKIEDEFIPTIEDVKDEVKTFQCELDQFTNQMGNLNNIFGLGGNNSFKKIINDRNIINPSDYQKLETLLSLKEWKKANRETSNLLLKSLKKQSKSRLNSEKIKQLSLEKLKLIDQLWKDYSDRKFGFSVQLEIWRKLHGENNNFNQEIYQKWSEQVGWKNQNQWNKYADLNFSQTAPRGQFPAITLMWENWGAAWCGNETIKLFSRLA